MRDALRERLHSVLSGEQLRVLALLTPPHSERQERPVREHQATLEALVDSWRLDDAQRADFRDARAVFRDTLRQWRDNAGKPDRDAWLTAREDYRQSLEEIFTPAQMVVLDDMLPALHKTPRHAM